MYLVPKTGIYYQIYIPPAYLSYGIEGIDLPTVVNSWKALGVRPIVGNSLILLGARRLCDTYHVANDEILLTEGACLKREIFIIYFITHQSNTKYRWFHFIRISDLYEAYQNPIVFIKYIIF